MRGKEDEEDEKLREKRGVATMREPHARQGRQAWTRSWQIANVRQKETREIKTKPRSGEDDPHKTRRNSDRGEHTGSTMMTAFEIFSLSRILP